jgi:hypothetical protein
LDGAERHCFTGFLFHFEESTSIPIVEPLQPM